MFLVMGISGRTGGSVANHLIDKGEQVRSLVRDPSNVKEWIKQGVEIIKGEWNTENMIQALQGIKGAFIMLPPIYTPSTDFSESRPLIEAYATALQSVKLPRLVVLSSNGAEKTKKLGAITPLSMLERALSALPYPHAFIRAGAFYENFLYGLQTTKGGTLPVFYANTNEKYPMTAIEDIGMLAAELLTDSSWKGKRLVELGSMVSPNELSSQLGKVIGIEVTAKPLSRELWTSTLEQMGFSSGQTWAFEEIYDGVNSQWIGFGAKDAERVEGSTTAFDVFSLANQQYLSQLPD
jgi:uncharacterized protein YbjT (DUF2867 family)